MPRFRPPALVFGASARPRTQVQVVERAAPKTTQADAGTVQSVSGYLGGTSWGTEQVDPAHARHLADYSVWVRAAISTMQNKVARAERTVVPIDPARRYDRALQRQFLWLIENPNPRRDSWRTFIEPIIADFCILGKAGWESCVNFRGWPVALYPFDARWMHIDPTWDGRRPHAPRYIWKPNGQAAIRLGNDEIHMFLDAPATHRPEGWSKIDTLRKQLDADAAADDFVQSMLQKYPPPGWLHLGKSSTAKQVKMVENALRQNVLGQGGMLVTGNLDSPDFKSLWQGTSREQELRAWSEWFGRKVAICFGISPIELGITSDANRASARTQQDIGNENGVIALLMLIEEVANRELLARYVGGDATPEDLNLAFRFKDVTWLERQKRAALVKDLAEGLPTLTLNELRAMEDMEPIAGGTAIFVKTAQGATAILGADKAAYEAERRAQAAATEDAEAQEGNLPEDAEAGEDDYEPAEDSGKDEVMPAEERAYARALVRAYLVVGHGTLDWTRTLDAAEVADLAGFVAGELTRRTARGLDRADPHQARRLHGYDRRLRRQMARLPQRAMPAYQILDMLEAAA